ncbi:unnamed protein product [Linum tenue]|uniref:Polygalacturonase n=1 Tax=Linum tenue TaxID=586396 RepID=A0AAV0IFM5_9ROSI|nr:unnamed protein product [Linum tenue]
MNKNMKPSGTLMETFPAMFLLVLVASFNMVGAQRGAGQPGMPATGPAPAAAGGCLFDVTKYGAVGDEKTDMSAVLCKAWADACGSAEPSTILIPAGKFLCGKTDLKGPCKSPQIQIQVLGTVTAPNDVAGESWFLFDNVNNLNINGNGVFDGQGPAIWKTVKSVAVTLRFNYVTNALIEGITSKDSKNFHFIVIGGKNLTFSHITITAAGDSPNTDGIHMGRAAQISILDSNIGTGDDCISVGDGISDLTVTNVTCGPGHGIAIGSLGMYPNESPVKGIHVKNCTLTNTLNGLRIKSWPDREVCDASDIHFDDIIMNNVSFPIIVDQDYCPWNTCKNTGPSKVSLSDISFTNIVGTSGTPEIVHLNCSSLHPCQNVQLSNIDVKSTSGPATSVCCNVKPTISGSIPPGC